MPLEGSRNLFSHLPECLNHSIWKICLLPVGEWFKYYSAFHISNLFLKIIIDISRQGPWLSWN